MNPSHDRRDFLKQASLGSSLALAASARAVAANERLTVALIGCGGMGTSHLRLLLSNPEVQVAYVCDVDRTRLEAAAKLAGKAKAIADLRQILDDKAVDAVWVATPDHWHGPATILALDAGKHVYVEKPCAHNIREGRLMIEAARRNRRICQVGTQSRSSETVRAAMKQLAEGAIGDVLVAKAWNSQKRRDIGHSSPGPVPEHLDFERWIGPAPRMPYQPNLLHYGWRWFYDFGTGDMGNDGVHEIDIARWGLGVTTHPSTIAAMGGKLFFDDDQQFADTQYVAFDYPAVAKGQRRRQLIFEMRIWSPYVQEGYENGNAFYGTNGVLILGKAGGWQIFGPKNQPGEKQSGSVDLPAHHRNFLACIRSGDQPNADIEIGHLSASLCHLGNLATRFGAMLQFDPRGEQIVNHSEAAALVRRKYRDHWATPKGA